MLNNKYYNGIISIEEWLNENNQIIDDLDTMYDPKWDPHFAEFCGGAAGHMHNVWEARDLTFGNIKEIISNGLETNIDNVQEKLDGMNLTCSFKDNKIVAARNKGHLKNLGATSLDINGMKEFFGGRGEIETAFVNAMIDLEKALKSSDLDLNAIFQNGKIWLNMEIIFPGTENVIPYGTSQIRMHHFREIDMNGELVNVNTTNLKELHNAIQNSKTFQNSKRTFLIAQTNPVTIKRIENSDKIKEQLLSELDAIEENSDLTIQDYINGKLAEYILNNLEGLSDNIVEAFIKRWGEDDKSISINKLLQNVNPKEAQWLRNADKDINVILKEIVKPIETIILKFGSTILLNIDGLAASNPSETSQKIRDKVMKAISDLYKYAEEIKSESIDIANKVLDFLAQQLERLELTGGIEKIAPTEGIVFTYKGQLLKITGSFAPVNQLTGYLKFNR
jgi:hypothetical protein